MIPKPGPDGTGWPGMLPPGVTLGEAKRMAVLLLEAIESGEPDPELVRFYTRSLGLDAGTAAEIVPQIVRDLRQVGHPALGLGASPLERLRRQVEDDE